VTTYETALHLYRSQNQPVTFDEALTWHLLHGFVFSRPDFFIMARPVISTAPYWQIADPSHHFPSAECNAWFIYLFSGNMTRAWEILPWELPLIGWGRHGETFFHPASTVKRLSLAA
jgi:hypothetical protein